MHHGINIKSKFSTFIFIFLLLSHRESRKGNLGCIYDNSFVVDVDLIVNERDMN